MPVNPPRSRLRSASAGPSWLTWLLGLALLGVLGAAAFLLSGGTLTVPGVGPISLLDANETDDDGPPPGKVAVPLSARPLAAYHKLGREDVWDRDRQRLAVTYLTPEKIEATGVLTDLGDILGRVLDHDKGAGYAFTESDFLPEGTRPGLVAGIPPGKRAMRVDVSKVEGLVGLNPGDRFDMLSSVPIDIRSDVAGSLGGVFADQMELQAELGAWAKQARVAAIVQNGVVVTAMETRSIPVSSNTLTRGLLTQQRPVQEMVVAVEPDEVAPLAEALALEVRILCVPRSGAPEPDETTTPSSDPRWPLGAALGGATGQGTVDELKLVDSIHGDRRTLTPVPRSP